MRPNLRLPLAAGLVLLAPAALIALQNSGPPACAPDNGGLTLPSGFCAIVIDGDAGSVRQLTVAPDGALYAAISGSGFGSGVRAYRALEGKPVEHASFGPRGGNDVKAHGGFLYLAMQNRIIRWKLTPGKLVPDGKEETIVSDLPTGGNHNSKSLAFGGGDTMFVSIGSATNSCQKSDRASKSPGIDPCTELERRAGIWQFSASKAGQTFASGRRYATGMRNPGATAIQPGTGALYAAINGRDQLGDSWGFSAERNAENPAEELVKAGAGDDFGWPYCYYSIENKAKVLAPEYGGDGKQVGRCAKAKDAVIPFPAHWAPLAHRVLSERRLWCRSTRTVSSSPFMDRGTARPSRRPAIASCSRRSPTARRRVSTRRLRPAAAAQPICARAESRWGRMGRSISVRIRMGRSGRWSEE